MGFVSRSGMHAHKKCIMAQYLNVMNNNKYIQQTSYDWCYKYLFFFEKTHILD